jgi:hypothetical protein
MLQPKKKLKAVNWDATRFSMENRSKTNTSVEPGSGPKQGPKTPGPTTPGGPNAPGKIGTLINKAKEKATSLYNKSTGRKVSSVSKEFDGKEVQGKRVERERKIGYGPIVQKGKTVKEVYKVPGAGKHIEKTRYNTSGDVVSKKVKDVGVNPSSFKTMKIEKAEKKIKRLKG